MKSLLILSFILILISIPLAAKNDSLLIYLKSGAIEKIALKDIKHIRFENVSSAENSHQQQGSLANAENYPNPFSESTTIEFETARHGDVEIFIYDISGKIVRKLHCRDCPSGKNTLRWDGKDDSGNLLPQGTYFYELRSGKDMASKKLIIIR